MRSNCKFRKNDSRFYKITPLIKKTTKSIYIHEKSCNSRRLENTRQNLKYQPTLMTSFEHSIRETILYKKYKRQRKKCYLWNWDVRSERSETVMWTEKNASKVFFIAIKNNEFFYVLKIPINCSNIYSHNNRRKIRHIQLRNTSNKKMPESWEKKEKKKNLTRDRADISF